jgi:hypothetical protein
MRGELFPNPRKSLSIFLRTAIAAPSLSASFYKLSAELTDDFLRACTAYYLLTMADSREGWPLGMKVLDIVFPATTKPLFRQQQTQATRAQGS